MTALFGNSLTAGTLGIPFTAYLNAALRPFGINGDTMRGVTARALSFLRRECRSQRTPAALLLECGSNDLLLPYMAAAGPDWEAAAMSLIKRNREPIPNITQLVSAYRDRLEAIIDAAVQSGMRPQQVAVLTVPILGEQLESVLNRKKRQLNTQLRRVCQELGISCIDPEFRFEQFLIENGNADGREPFFPDQTTPDLFERDAAFIAGSLERALQLSRERRLLVTTDGLHFNGEGARLLAEELREFLNFVNQIKSGIIVP